MINILIDRTGKTSKENIFLGNQHENLDETLHFSFPSEYDNFYKYITYSYINNGCRITGISPLVDDNFIITSKITKCSGVWELNLICKVSPVNLDDKVIDLTENNSTKEHIFISNTISACVSGNNIDVEAFNNVAIDENIASLYDSILALKNRVEENDKAHEQNEEIRKANEAERQKAETARKQSESERVNAEQLRIEAENARKANETERQSNENARVNAETERASAENKRVNAENQRAEAETARQSAEINRVSAENKRVNAEVNRDSAERERVSAEKLRKQAESARVNAETARSQAEANRAEAERTRVSAENARISAEQSRVNVESQRVTAEEVRESAEHARIEAESARAQAEQSRVNAENLRVQAENKRNSVITKLREDVDSNTKEVGKTSRSLSALWDLNKGISYKFETDETKAYKKQVPSGAKLGAVNKIGGKTIVYNQLIDPSRRKGIDFDEQTKHFKYSNWTVTAGNKYICIGINAISGHKYYLYATDKVRYALLYMYGDSFSIAFTKPEDAETEVKEFFTATNSGKNQVYFNRYLAKPENVSYFDGCINLIDLTKMFGSGNEPSTVEEFEAMFPNDYYPYNEGELMSMSVNNVENVGKNLFECHNFSCYGLDGSYNPSLSNSYGTSIKSTEPSNSITVTQSKVEQVDSPTDYKNGYFCVSFNPIILDKDYVFSFDVIPSKKTD